MTGNKKHFPIEVFIKSPKEMLDLIENDKMKGNPLKIYDNFEVDTEKRSKDENNENTKGINRDKEIGNENDGR